MTIEGYYEMGDVVEVPAWWNGDRPTVCDVIRDQCYLNAFTSEMVIGTLLTVRPRGLAGAHSRSVKVSDIIRNVQGDSTADKRTRCSCGVAIESLSEDQRGFHLRAGHHLSETTS